MHDFAKLMEDLEAATSQVKALQERAERAEALVERLTEEQRALRDLLIACGPIYDWLGDVPDSHTSDELAFRAAVERARQIK